MDRVAAPRAPEAEPSPPDAPAASGASALRVTAQTFTPAASATERVPAPRAPEAEPGPHDTLAASVSPMLRATARKFTPGQGARVEDASWPPPTATAVAPEVLPPRGPDAAWPSTGEVAPGQDKAGHGPVKALALPPRTYADATVDGAMTTDVAHPWAEPWTEPWTVPCTPQWTQPRTP